MVACLLSVPALGSDSPPVAAGSRVRVTTALPSGKAATHTGLLSAIDEQTLTLGSSDGQVHRMRRADLTRFEVSVRPSRRGKGALIGAGIGTALALGLAVACESDEEGYFGTCLAVGTVLLAGPGAAIGALAAGGERWAAAPVDRVGIGVGPGRGRRLAASITVRF